MQPHTEADGVTERALDDANAMWVDECGCLLEKAYAKRESKLGQRMRRMFGNIWQHCFKEKLPIFKYIFCTFVMKKIT